MFIRALFIPMRSRLSTACIVSLFLQPVLVVLGNIDLSGDRFIIVASTASTAVSNRHDLELAMERVLDFPYQNVSEHAKFDWKVGTYFTGVMEAYAATGNPKFYQASKQWSEDRKWKIRGTPLFADNLCLGQTYAELYLIDKNPEMIRDLKLKLEPYFSRDKIIKKEFYTKWSETERAFTGRNVWWWIDSLYMAPPLFAQMYQATGEQRYLDLLHTFYWDVVDYLYDRDEQLLFRDMGYFNAKTPKGKKVFWSRGNGWVYGGLVHILDALPDKDARRGDYLRLYRELTESIIKYQAADGLWRTSLNEPEWFPAKESSASSFFCYGLLAGINRGWLSREQHLGPALNAWSGLQGCLNEKGWMGHAQIEAEHPGLAIADAYIDYTQGAYLLAAAELYKLNLHGEPSAKSVASPFPSVSTAASTAVGVIKK